MHLADETRFVHHGHTDRDLLVAPDVDLDQLVEIARCLADHLGGGSRQVGDRFQVVECQQLLVLDDHVARCDLSAELLVDALLKAFVLRDQVVVLGDAAPGIANRVGGDAGGRFERRKSDNKQDSRPIEHRVATQVDREEQDRRQQQEQDDTTSAD